MGRTPRVCVFGWANDWVEAGGVNAEELEGEMKKRDGRERRNRVSIEGAGSEGDDPSVITPLFSVFVSL